MFRVRVGVRARFGVRISVRDRISALIMHHAVAIRTNVVSVKPT